MPTFTCHLVGPEDPRSVSVGDGRLFVTANHLDLGAIAVDDGHGW